MKATDKIYIYDHAGGNSYSISPTDNVADKKHEIEYLRKSALLEWADGMKEGWSDIGQKGVILVLDELIDKINSL